MSSAFAIAVGVRQSAQTLKAAETLASRTCTISKPFFASSKQVSVKNIYQPRETKQFYVASQFRSVVSGVPPAGSPYGPPQNSSPDAQVAQAITQARVVPDVLEPFQPTTFLHVSYAGDLKVNYGNVMTPTNVHTRPQVRWNAEPDSWYTLALTDPDAPSRHMPRFREWQHWLVGNIPGDDLSQGQTLAEYVGSGPPKGTGQHRYVFVLYKQPGKIDFDEPIKPRSGDGRPNFRVRQFAQKYNLSAPIACNFFLAEWDPYSERVFEA